MTYRQTRPIGNTKLAASWFAPPPLQPNTTIKKGAQPKEKAKFVYETLSQGGPLYDDQIGPIPAERLGFHLMNARLPPIDKRTNASAAAAPTPPQLPAPVQRLIQQHRISEGAPPFREDEKSAIRNALYALSEAELKHMAKCMALLHKDTLLRAI